MMFFKSLAVAATLAFGAVSALAGSAGGANNLVARCDSGCDGLATIVTNVHANIKVHADVLAAVTPEKCTTEHITPVVEAIKHCLVDATAKVNLLVGADAKVILASTDGKTTLEVKVLAKIIADLIITVFAAIKVCISVCPAATLIAIRAILCGLGEVLGAFVSAIVHVCANVCVGLAAEIYACIAVVVSVIVDLKVRVLLSVLNIHV